MTVLLLFVTNIFILLSSMNSIDNVEEYNYEIKTDGTILINPPITSNEEVIINSVQVPLSLPVKKSVDLTNEHCIVSSFDVLDTQKMFNGICGLRDFEFLDCDPISGQWICSSKTVGNVAPVDQNGNGIITNIPIKGTNSEEPNAINWVDSYEANGKCFIDSTFDHGVGDIIVDTGILGKRSVRDIDIILKGDPLYRPRIDSDLVYNDVQCGHGPANISGNEDRIGGCPGRVDLGREGCSILGPAWNFDYFRSGQQTNLRDLVVDIEDITPNNTISLGDIWADMITENESRIWISGFSDNLAGVLEYISIAYPSVDTKMINVVAKYDKNDVGTDSHDTIVSKSVFIGTKESDDINRIIEVNMK